MKGDRVAVLVVAGGAPAVQPRLHVVVAHMGLVGPVTHHLHPCIQSDSALARPCPAPSEIEKNST